MIYLTQGGHASHYSRRGLNTKNNTHVP